MKFSIIVPVYNVEAFLPKCLDSILEQDFTDFEVIVVNDKSPDNSHKIITNYSEKDNRIVTINHDINKGLGGARNTGIEYSQGEYIVFLDSDDWLAKGALKNLIDSISTSDYDFIKFGYVESFGDGSSKTNLPFNNKTYSDGWKLILEEIKNQSFSPICWRSFYKTAFLKGNNLFFPENLHFEDFSFTIKSHLLAKKISTVQIPAYYYRQDREGSIMHKPSLRDIEVCKTLQMIFDFTSSSEWDTVTQTGNFNFLMYEWSAGTTIYRYLKNNFDNSIKNQVVHELRSNKYFNHYLDQVINSKDLSFIKKLPPYLLRNNYTFFKLTYALYRFIVK